MPKFMTVKSPDGKTEEEFDYASGRDLVNNAGWTEVSQREVKPSKNPTPPKPGVGIIDPRSLYVVQDLAGTQHTMSWINASDMERNVGWRIIGKAEDVLAAPVEPVADASVQDAAATAETKKRRGRPSKAEAEAARLAAEAAAALPPKPPEGSAADVTLYEYAEFARLDLSVITQAAKACEIEADPTWSRERLLAEIESTIDQRLTESGDFDGASPVDPDMDDEGTIALKVEAATARRQRAYVLEGTRQGFDAPAEVPPFDVMLEAFAAPAD